ncbi:MAG: prepilin-type N-terminal cleavage/methylation domain-containing protein [Planctomycetia bacterium]|nr:prepilin-type N-terminal cleavage/methylation domain-containing protein [Planctomycetia bacterium]
MKLNHYQNKISRTRELPNSVSHGLWTLHKNKGVTLIELIITMSLIAILSGIVGFMIASAFKTIDHMQRRKVIAIDGAHASEMFRRDMSLMKNASSLLYAGSQRLQFITAADQTIEYQIANGYLYRTILGQGDAHILAKAVNTTNNGFQYFNSENTALTSLPLQVNDRNNVWMITLYFEMVNFDETIHFNSTVFPKNHHINHDPAV